MNMQQLYYFRHLAETCHLRQSAEELFISPAALSASISNLEGELNTTLFNHVGRKLVLNEEGKTFYTHTIRIISELELARKEISKRDNEKSITLLTNNTIAFRDVILKYIIENPDVVFHYRAVNEEQVASIPLNNPDAFVLCTIQDVILDEYDYRVINEENYNVIVVHKDHPLSNRSEIHLLEVADEKIVVPPLNYAGREYLNRLYAAGGRTPNIIAEGDFKLRMDIVEAKKGICIAPSESVKNYESEDNSLRFIRIIEPKIPRTQAIAWPKKKKFSEIDTAFLEFFMAQTAE